MHPSVKRSGPGTRERILDVAAGLMHTQGLARATTREIARAAGVSEAALYKHFQDKEELFLRVLAERLPNLEALLGALANRVGTGRVQDHLDGLARAALAFYDQSFPIAASLFSDTRLLEAHRAAMLRYGAGPEHPNQALSAYLRAEQHLGRLAPDTDPDAAAALLLGACLQHAFLRRFAGTPWDAGDMERVAGPLVQTLVAGLGTATR